MLTIKITSDLPSGASKFKLCELKSFNNFWNDQLFFFKQDHFVGFYKFGCLQHNIMWWISTYMSVCMQIFILPQMLAAVELESDFVISI